MGCARGARAIADAAAEHPGQRGAPADERIDRPDTVAMPVGQIVGADERDPARSPTSSPSWSRDSTKRPGRLDDIREGLVSPRQAYRSHDGDFRPGARGRGTVPGAGNSSTRNRRRSAIEWITMDLPVDDSDASFEDYADVVCYRH